MRGAVHTVGPHADATDLQAALDAAAPGDTVEVESGLYDGPFHIDKPLHLVGRGGPVLDGGNQGTVLQITAPGASLRGFVIRRSGKSLDRENSGVAVEAPDIVVEDNRIEDTLFGIYLRKASGSVVRGNRIEGKDLAVPRRGDPIRVWYSNHVRIEDNEVSHGRDVVLWYSTDLHVEGNRVHDGRYGLHFMYCDDALIRSNSLTHNAVGAFLMYSRRLHMVRNIVAHNRGPSGYGIGMKDMDDAVVEENLFVGNRVGAYVDNSPREIDSTARFTGCVFAYNDAGIRILPNVQRNVYRENSFVSNLEQVEVTGGGLLKKNAWMEEGRGNYWSDYAGYDADGDGVGDLAYRSRRFFEQVMDRKPGFRLFAHSPAADALDFAAKAFPIFQPQAKLTDDRPLMHPIVPEGLPHLPHPPQRTFRLASLALLMTGLGLVGLSGIRDEAVTTPLADTKAPPLGEGHPGIEPGVIISVAHVAMRFGKVRALNDVSFNIPAGQAIALWGPNGAGKTTLLRCLLGLLPYRGSVKVGGHDTRREGKAARRLIGFVPQELHFHDTMSVRETLAFYAKLKKAPRTECEELARRLELDAQARKQVGALSGGMKQRLALAVALLGNPPVLLLDEPTANLDLQSRDRFLHLLQDLRASGKTLVFCSHHLDEVVSACERIVVLEDGQLRADCAPDELDRQLGWGAFVYLDVPEEDLDRALRALTANGFEARRHVRGIVVPVETRAKVGPLNVLAAETIPLRDFSYTLESKRRTDVRSEEEI